jgi:TDG/mug DNA glycosylase family protein
VSLVRLPIALARIHWATTPGDAIEWDMPASARVDDVIAGAGFERLDERRARRLRTLPDTVGPGMRILVCGLNPSLISADVGFGFASPSNRFWRAATAAGLISKPRDSFHALIDDRVGMTDLVKRATKGTADLSPAEYRAGTPRVERLVRWLKPSLVLFVGLEGWRAAVDRKATSGLQPGGFGGAAAYVMPSTSGLNAHARPADLVAHMRAATEGR